MLKKLTMKTNKKTSRDMPGEQIDSVSNLFSLLSHSIRIKILWLLKKEKSLNVTEIQKELNISQSSASQHLHLLKLNKLIIEEREGKEVYYSLVASKNISKVLASALQLIGCQLAINNELLSTYSEVASFWI